MQQSYYCNVYRDASGGDCTNGGASSRFKRATLWRGRVPKGSTSDSIAIFELVETNVSGEPYPKAVPAGETRWTMFGGNFLWSCDSRFRNEVSERPIPIHDRVE